MARVCDTLTSGFCHKEVFVPLIHQKVKQSNQKLAELSSLHKPAEI